MNKRWLLIDTDFFVSRPPTTRNRPSGTRPNETDEPRTHLTFEAFQYITRAGAEEAAENLLTERLDKRYVIFEAVLFMENVPAPPVRKIWNINGELQDNAHA